MEAQKLKTKRSKISKGKIKKTIKNVISRPDPLFWPVVTEVDEKTLKVALMKHRVHIPEFKKLHWNDLKLIPKKERAQPPPIPKVDGLLFGISACCYAIKMQNCIAVLIEANVNPRAIVQSILEACTSSNTSVLCIKDLRQLSATNFGIKTSCLGVKKDCLQELYNKIQDIFQNYKPKRKCMSSPALCPKIECSADNMKKEESSMDVDTYCPYIYRTDKKSRVFVPTNTLQENDVKVDSRFRGQHFIKITQQSEPKIESKAYMKMILKKISNNPNRLKI